MTDHNSVSSDHTAVVTKRIDLAPVLLVRFGLCLGLTSPDPDPGGLYLPRHWALVGDETPTHELARDGLPLDPLLGQGFDQRIWGGCHMEVQGHAAIGLPADCRRSVRSMPIRHGHAPAQLVETRIELSQGTTFRLFDSQRVVYRRAHDDRAPVAPHVGRPPHNPRWTWTHAVSTVDAFRFASITMNPHRIHYDAPYAVEEEGWPGLVVNGHLLAALACELARRHAKRPIDRAVAVTHHPVFVGEELTFVGSLDRLGRTVVGIYGSAGSEAASVALTLGPHDTG